MSNQFDFRPGVFRIINAKGLQVRGTMDTSHNGNLTGQTFTFGKMVPIYRVLADKKGWMWGVITPPEVPAPQTLFVCLWDLNTVFAELVSPFESDLTNPVLAALLRIEAKLDQLLKEE